MQKKIRAKEMSNPDLRGPKARSYKYRPRQWR